MSITYDAILELRKQRRKITEDMRGMLTVLKDEKRDFSAEEKEKYERMEQDLDSLKTQVDREERLWDHEKELGEVLERKAAIQTTEDRVNEASAAEKRREAFRRWGLGGVQELDQEQRKVIGIGQHAKLDGINASGSGYSMRLAPSSTLPEPYWERGGWRFDRKEFNERYAQYQGVEARQQTVTTTGGGYAIADAPMAGLEEAMLAFGGMRQVGAKVYRTDTGGDLPIPTINDTGSGALLAINTAAAEGALTFGQVVLGAYKYTSKYVLVPWELMQDISFDLEAYLARALGTRIGRILNTHFTAGTGSGQPNGVKNVANGAVTTVASASAITAAELITFQEALDPAYDQNARFMFNQSTRSSIRQLQDDGPFNYLWRPGLAFREPDTLLGKPYVINQDMRSIGADKRSVLYGDFEAGYAIRDVMDIQVVRIDGTYNLSAQTAFVAFSRHDGDLTDAGTNPIQALRHPAS